jgi:hypothetical protein
VCHHFGSIAFFKGALYCSHHTTMVGSRPFEDTVADGWRLAQVTIIISTDPLALLGRRR